MILAEKNDGIFSDDYNITPNSYEDFFTQFNTMGRQFDSRERFPFLGIGEIIPTFQILG